MKVKSKFLSLLLALAMLATMVTALPVFAADGVSNSITITTSDTMKSLDLTTLMTDEQKSNMVNGGEVTVNYTIEFTGSAITQDQYIDLIGAGAPETVPNDNVDDTRYIRTRLKNNWTQLDLTSGTQGAWDSSNKSVMSTTNSEHYLQALNVGGKFTKDDKTYSYATQIKINYNDNTVKVTTTGDSNVATDGFNGKELTFDGMGKNVDKNKLTLVAYNKDGKIAYNIKDISVSVAEAVASISLDKTFARVDGDGSVTIIPSFTALSSPDYDKLTWSSNGAAMSYTKNADGSVTITKGTANSGDTGTFTASYQIDEATTLTAVCKVLYVGDYGYSLTDSIGSTYYYLGNSSLDGGGGSLDSTKGPVDLNGDPLAISENFKFSNGAATITLPEVNLAEKDYDRVVINVAVGSSHKITAKIKVGDEVLATISDMNTSTSGDWTGYTDFGADFSNTTASGNITLELSTTSGSTYCGNYVYVKFLKGVGNLPKTYKYPGTIANFGVGGTGTDKTVYSFVDGVDEKVKAVFANQNDPGLVKSELTANLLNYIGNDESNSNKGDPYISNLDLPAGTYNIYYLGKNARDGVQVAVGGKTVAANPNKGVDFAKNDSGTTLRLYTMSLELTEDLENGTMTFSESVDNTFLPDLYSVVIAVEPGFGESESDAGRYNDGETLYGVIRYLQEYTGSQPSEYGFYFLDSSGKIVEANRIYSTDDTIGEAGGFYGDLKDIPEAGFGTYYAKAYVVVDGFTYYTDSIGGVVTSETKMIDYPETESAGE